MTKTAIIFSPKYFRHKPGRGHPESPKRLSLIMNELMRSKLSESKNIQFVKPEKASIEDVKMVHSLKYIKFVEETCKFGGGPLDNAKDTIASPESFEVALYAVGGAIKAVDLVMENKFENAFVLVRPPGHHAEKFRACGFCIFNNVAVAAKHLIRKHGLKRILILDMDAHHGNGTQQAFYKTCKVLYISLHEDPKEFPGTGFLNEIGEGEGLGYNVNIPFPFGTDDQTYLRAFEEIVVPVAYQYKPQFILVSAGLDGHHTDPVANLSLTASCYQTVYDTLLELTSKMCEGKLVSVLEGGYSKFIGKLAAAIIAKKCSMQYSVNDKIEVKRRGRGIKQSEKIINEAKGMLKNFWNLA
ncbi:MAG: histone deacetylase [Candidatus Bathyarchaeia archaeon]